MRDTPYVCTIIDELVDIQRVSETKGKEVGYALGEMQS